MKLCISQYLKSVLGGLVGIELEDQVDKPNNKVRVKGEIKDPKYKAPPRIKPKRREHTLSDWDYKDKSRDYMKEYRAEGKDIENGNKYVKKIKGA